MNETFKYARTVTSYATNGVVKEWHYSYSLYVNIVLFDFIFKPLTFFWFGRMRYTAIPSYKDIPAKSTRDMLTF